MTTPIRLLGPLLLCLVLFQNCTLLEELESLNPEVDDITVSLPAKEIRYTVPATDETGPYLFKETVAADIQTDMTNLGYPPTALDGARVSAVELHILSKNPAFRTKHLGRTVLRVRARGLEEVRLTRAAVNIINDTLALLPVHEDIDVLEFLKAPEITYSLEMNFKDTLRTVSRPVDIRILPEVVITGSVLGL